MSCSDNQPPNRDDDEKRERKLRAQYAAWIRLGRRIFIKLLIRHGKASIDDVRDLLTLPIGIDPKLFGAIPKGSGFDKIIEPTDYVRTRRRIAHGRPITLWRLKDLGAAQEWLRSHPALPDEAPIKNGETAE